MMIVPTDPRFDDKIEFHYKSKVITEMVKEKLQIFRDVLKQTPSVEWTFNVQYLTEDFPTVDHRNIRHTGEAIITFQFQSADRPHIESGIRQAFALLLRDNPPPSPQDGK